MIEDVYCRLQEFRFDKLSCRAPSLVLLMCPWQYAGYTEGISVAYSRTWTRIYKSNATINGSKNIVCYNLNVAVTGVDSEKKKCAIFTYTALLECSLHKLIWLRIGLWRWKRSTCVLVQGFEKWSYFGYTDNEGPLLKACSFMQQKNTSIKVEQWVTVRFVGWQLQCWSKTLMNGYLLWLLLQVRIDVNNWMDVICMVTKLPWVLLILFCWSVDCTISFPVYPVSKSNAILACYFSEYICKLVLAGFYHRKTFQNRLDSRKTF